MIRRSYADVPQGQLHLRHNRDVGGTPLVCLHATAYSSRTFARLMTALDGERTALAVDTPGYGESDALLGQPGIADYAAGIIDALPEKFDLFGYHTGVAIAVEIALGWPDRVGQLTLMGIPHFRALDFEEWKKKLTVRHRLETALSQFDERWNFLVNGRPEGLSLRRGFENFVDEMKAWPEGWRSHAALFDWSLETRLGKLMHPVRVLNPPGHLAEPSRVASALIPNVVLVECDDLTGAVFEKHATEVAALLA